MKDLTPRQKVMLEKLRHRGAHLTAYAAERAWKNGRSYYLDSRNEARRGLVRDFERCNQEATTNQAPGK